MNKGKNKIKQSVHYKFILDCIEKDYNVKKIQELLEQRGMKLSVATISKFIKEVKMQGINVTQFKNDTENTALAINEKLKKIPELSTIFKRRNFLMENLLVRRQKLMDYEDEKDRVSELLNMFNSLSNFIKNKEDSKILPTLDTIRAYIRSNFKGFKPDASVENLVRAYTMDIHELCKYVEQWTSKYEINELLEKMCKEITKCAIESFGNYLKKESPVIRQKIIENFVNGVEAIIKDIKDYELELGEHYETK